jgi:hypothetical protein
VRAAREYVEAYDAYCNRAVSTNAASPAAQEKRRALMIRAATCYNRLRNALGIVVEEDEEG